MLLTLDSHQRVIAWLALKFEGRKEN